MDTNLDVWVGARVPVEALHVGIRMVTDFTRSAQEQPLGVIEHFWLDVDIHCGCAVSVRCEPKANGVDIPHCGSHHHLQILRIKRKFPDIHFRGQNRSKITLLVHKWTTLANICVVS
jgi:hypothetical protein